MQSLSLSGPISRVWRAYEQQLHRRPILTQMTTSALLWGLGDVLAQKVVEQRKTVDARRCVLTAGFGAGFMGPIGHHWYIALDVVTGKFLRPGGAAFLAAKVLVDSFIFGPIYVMAFYAYGCAVIDGSGLSGFVHKMEKDFVPTFLAELAIWPAFQTWNFTKVPLAHQLLAINCATLVDATFLSWTRSQEDWFGNLTGLVQGRDKGGGTEGARAVVARGLPLLGPDGLAVPVCKSN